MAASARMSDVAKLAGVSTMTVSRVLNQNPNVTDSTRERVFAAIQQLRYQPNELARSLREQRSRQIGIIVPYLFDPFFATCAHVISTVARKHSYSVVLSTSNESPDAEFEEASRMLRRNVDGLIVIPAHPKNGASLLLADEFEDLPIVTLDRPIEGSRFDSVLVENERGAQIGTNHLISLGHKRIAYIGLTDELYTMHMRHGATGSATATLTITTTAPSTAVMKYPGSRWTLIEAAGGAGLASVLLFGFYARRRKVWGIAATFILALLLTSGLGGCSSGKSSSSSTPPVSNPGTTPGSYVVTVTGTSGNTTTTLAVPVTVQ